MPKTLLKITITLLVILIGVLFIYNFGLKEKPREKEAPPEELPEFISEEPTKPLPTKIQRLSEEKVLWPAINEDDKKILYFSQANGNLFESDFNGQNIKKLSSVTLKDLIHVIWSPRQDKVIGIFDTEKGVRKYLYNYKTNQSISLNEKIGWFNWSPDGQQIVYQFIDPAADTNVISLAKPDGSEWKNIFKTRLANLIVEWPVKNKVSIRTPTSGLAQSVLYIINPDTGDFNKVLSDFYGFSSKWSPRADKIIFSSTNSHGRDLTLSWTDEKGANRQILEIATLVEKCVWSKDNQTIFCAVPQKIPANAVLPDDYYKGKIAFSDDFYEINLLTNARKKIAESGLNGNYDAQNLLLSSTENLLFFLNRRDGLLYSLKLF